MSYHAKLSPSSAHRWSSCTASVAAQEGLEDDGNDASRMGTMCHDVSERVIRDGIDPYTYVGNIMTFWSTADASGEVWGHAIPEGARCTGAVMFEDEHADAVTRATNYVKEYHALHGGKLYTETRVPIDHITGEEGAGGTADIVIVGDDWITTMDYKYGRKEVHAFYTVVDAHTDPITGESIPAVTRMNKQLAMYASGALRKLWPEDKDPCDLKRVSAHIIQPFLGKPVSDYTADIAEVCELIAALQKQAEETRTNPQFVPSEHNCLFCKAAGNCAAQTKAAVEAAVEGFEDVNTARPREVSDLSLGDKYALIPIMRSWIDAIEQRVDAALTEGKQVTRTDGLYYKRVAGKKGARKWADENTAAARLHELLRDDQIYTKSVNGPAAIEKLTKGKDPALTKKTWGFLQELIVQSEGKPAIALSTDPRPALEITADGFESIPPEDNSDLF